MKITFTGVNIGVNARTFIEWKQVAQSVSAWDNVTNDLMEQKIRIFSLLTSIYSVIASWHLALNFLAITYHRFCPRDSTVSHIPWPK